MEMLFFNPAFVFDQTLVILRFEKGFIPKPVIVEIDKGVILRRKKFQLSRRNRKNIVLPGLG